MKYTTIPALLLLASACSADALTDQKIHELELEMQQLSAQVSQLEQGMAKAALIAQVEPSTSWPNVADPTRCRSARTPLHYVYPGLGTTPKLSDVRIVPFFADGEQKGFKIYKVSYGSLAASCGLDSGDVITKINDINIDSPDSALKAYAKAQQEGTVRIRLLRGGHPMQLEIKITDT